MTQKYQVKVSMKQAAIVETGIVLKQGDFGMQIEIEVLDFDATGTTPQIVFRKAMGAVESTTITVSSNKYTYTFRGTELDTPGKVFCDLKLKNSTTQRISTASFMFKVVADTMDGLEQEASSYSDTIEQIVAGFDTVINDIKNNEKNEEKLSFIYTNIIQGTYLPNGGGVDPVTYIVRMADLQPTYPGQRYSFKAGTNIANVQFVAFNNDKVHTAHSSWLNDGASYISNFDGFMLVIFKRANTQAITPSEYDAELTIESKASLKFDELSFYSNNYALQNKSEIANMQKESKIEFSDTGYAGNLYIPAGRTPIYINPILLYNKKISALSVFVTEDSIFPLYKGKNLNSNNYTEELLRSYYLKKGWNHISFEKELYFNTNESLGTRLTKCVYDSTSNEGMLFGTNNQGTYTWTSASTSTLWLIPWSYTDFNKDNNNDHIYMDFNPYDVTSETIGELYIPGTRTGIYVNNYFVREKRTYTGVKLYAVEDSLISIYKGRGILSQNFNEELIYWFSAKAGWNTFYFPDEIVLNSNESLGTRTSKVGYVTSGSLCNWVFANISDNTYSWVTSGSILLFDLIEKKPAHSLKGIPISILGDSISTFDGYIPEENVPYYYKGTFNMTVHDTWWDKLLRATGADLVVNNSYSGSLVSGHDPSAGTNRCEKLHTSAKSPLCIIIYMGTNDYWRDNTVLGSWNGKNPIPSDVDSFYSAYCVMLKKIQTLYPKAKIYCCTLPIYNMTFNPDEAQYFDEYYEWEFNEAIRNIAQKFNCEVIELNECGINTHNAHIMYGDYRPNANPPHVGVHPGLYGHEMIYKKIYQTLQ